MNEETKILLELENIKGQLMRINSRLDSLNGDIIATDNNLNHFIDNDFKNLRKEHDQGFGVLEFIKWGLGSGIMTALAAIGWWIYNLGH